MPFKFLAEIQTPDGKALWAKSIYHLSTISDTLKVSIRQSTINTESISLEKNNESYSEVCLTAVNMSKTAMLNCSFRTEFFALLQIDGELPSAAVEGDINQARVFSFLVNSKNLNTLFNICGLNAEKFKLLVIGSELERTGEHGDELATLFNNKLFVECETKTGMTKNYKLNFVRSRESFDLQIRSEIKTLLNYQESNPDNLSIKEKVNYLCLDPKILRNFLSMFPSNLEDFRIDLDPRDQKVLFYGYNRQSTVSNSSSAGGSSATKKDSVPVLSPSMSLSIEIGLQSLDYSNVQVPPVKSTASGQQDDDINKIKTSYRLRDFKSFVNLVSQAHYRFGSNSETNRQQVERNRNKGYVTSMDTNGLMSNYDSIPKDSVINGSQVAPLHILFSGEGPFAMFERSYEEVEAHESLKYCQMSLFLMIDQEVDKIVMKSNSKLSVSGPVARSLISSVAIPGGASDKRKRQKQATADPSTSNKQQREPLFVTDEHDDDFAHNQPHADENDVFHDRDDDGDVVHNELYNPDGGGDNEKQTESQNAANEDNNFNDVFWDNSRFHQTEISENNKGKESTNSNVLRKHKINDNEDDEDEGRPKIFVNLGPTQNVTRVKGIFD